MDKAKFIKKAKEYEYSDKEIDRMIKNYETDLKDGIDIDPIIFLISPEERGEDVSFTVPTQIFKEMENVKN